MLGKLIKYEFKSTSRIMWFLYGALIIVGALLGLMIRVGGSDGVSSVIPDMYMVGENEVYRIMLVSLVFIYVLMIQAIFIMTIFMIITRFYRNLLGDEGYLMHTLPVKTHELIISKGVVAIIWGIIAILSGLLSGFLFSVTSGILRVILQELTWSRFMEFVSRIMTSEFALGLVLLFVGSLASILGFYFAMSIGSLANKNKIFYMVLAYIVIQIIMSVIFTIIGEVNGGFLGNIFGAVFTNRSFDGILIVQIIQQAIAGIAFFFGTNYILKNKLNLA